MGFKKFTLSIVIRTLFLMLTLLIAVHLTLTPGYLVTTLCLFGLMMYQCFLLVRYVSKTNAELVRFFDAARYADFSQRFEMSNLGAGFSDLGQAFSDILKRIQAVRTEQEKELRHLKALVEHVPVPLMSLHNQGELTLWNNSARRLFGTNPVTKLDDLEQFGPNFKQQIQNLKLGERLLVNIEVDNMSQQLTVNATQLVVAGSAEMLISMQDIRSELDGAQLEAWQDLVRVLTHEIMNSITPVASLAKTAVDLVEDVKTTAQQHPNIVSELDDVTDAVQTVARRSDGLMQFVGSYRRLTRLPPPKKQDMDVTTLFKQVTQIACQYWSEKNLSLKTRVEPESLSILIDVDMVEQMLINLLLNAEQALESTELPQVQLRASLNKRGHVVIEVADNGPGVSKELRQKIFVPFFTTKREGSGVGLALTRQVMIAHGGNVKIKDSEHNGANFVLTF